MGYMISACLKYYELREVLFFFSSYFLFEHPFSISCVQIWKARPQCFSFK